MSIDGVVTGSDENVEGIEFFLRVSLHKHWIELIFKKKIPRRRLLIQCIEHSVRTLYPESYDVYLKSKHKLLRVRYNGRTDRIGKKFTEIY